MVRVRERRVSQEQGIGIVYQRVPLAIRRILIIATFRIQALGHTVPE